MIKAKGHPLKGHKWSKEILIKRGLAISKAKTGNTFFSKEHRMKIGLASKGHVLSAEARNKIRLKLLGNKNSKGNTGRKGRLASNWRGGRSKEYELIRNSAEYKLWRKAVMERDKWTCVWCGYRSRKRADIHADHIQPFALFPELRFAIDNGRVLCVPCHKKTYSYLNNKITKLQFQLAI